MKEHNTDLNKKLAALQWHLRRKQALAHGEHRRKAGSAHMRSRVLALLKLQPEMNAKDMADLLDIHAQPLHEFLGELEKEGCIHRIPSEADPSAILVRLTQQGKDQGQAKGQAYCMFDCLSQEEQTAFGGYLDRVIASLKEHLDTEEALQDWPDGSGPEMGAPMPGRHFGFAPHSHGRHRDCRFGGFGAADRGSAPFCPDPYERGGE